MSSQSWIIEGDAFSESYTYNDPSDETGAPQDGSLKQMTTATGDTLHYAYDALKRLSSTTAKDADGATLLTSAYAYKNLSTTNGITQTTGQVEFHNVRGADGTLLTGAKYAYDEVGNIIGIYESQLVGTNTTRRPLALYTYDVQNQLTGETIYTYASDNLTATPTTTTVYAYTYDTAGNILTESKNGAVTKTYTYGNSNWNDLLTAINGTTITYDAIGNPTSYANSNALYTFEWVNGRTLASALVDGADRYAIRYDYDLDGIRTQKMVENEVHNYVTQNGKVVRETIGSGATAQVLDFIYDASGRPFALKYTNGTADAVTYYYVLNLQGDVVGLIDENADFVAKYTYNAWGEILTSSGTMAEINPLRYRGYYYDTETGFYYLQSRYYDPAMHRFINADSLASTGQGIVGTNMFAYCRNCPVFRIDQTGKYDRDAAVEYAEEWYDDENTDDYYEYSTDCANFVSQCLVAGGIEMSDGWYSRRTPKPLLGILIDPRAWFYNKFRYHWDISESWRLADEQYKYFSNEDNGYTDKVVIKIYSPQLIADYVQSGNIQKGDLIYFSKDGKTAYHAAIITRVENGMIYYAAHSKSRFDCPLNETMNNDVVFIVRINDDA